MLNYIANVLLFFLFTYAVYQNSYTKVKHHYNLQHFKVKEASDVTSRLSQAAQQLNVVTQIKMQLLLLIKRHPFASEDGPTVLTATGLSFRLKKILIITLINSLRISH